MKHRIRSKVFWLPAVAFGVILTVWLSWCVSVLVMPTVQHATSADAVVVLGPPNADGRLATALNLIDDHLAPNLVVSYPGGASGTVKHLCNGDLTISARVTCFEPSPATTRGEAEELRRLAKTFGWTRVIVVTSRYHISRARLLIQRCFHGQLEMLASDENPGVLEWGYQFAYQSVAFAKAYASPAC